MEKVLIIIAAEQEVGGFGSGLPFDSMLNRILFAHPAILHLKVSLCESGKTMPSNLEALGGGYSFAITFRNWISSPTPQFHLEV